MRNKLFFLLLTLAASLLAVSTAYAFPAGSDATWQEDPGFSFEEGYVGALLGSNQSHYDLNVKTSEPLQPAFLNQNFSTNQNNISGGVMAGYGVSFQHTYFGVEVSTQPLPVTATINRTDGVSGDPVSDKITSYNLGNLDFIPGYYFGRSFLTYARVGVGASYYKLDQKTDGVDEINSSTWSAGWRLGFGFDWRIAQHFGLGMDYIHSHYLNSDFSDTTSDVDGLEKDISLNSQTNNLIAAHLRYYF